MESDSSSGVLTSASFGINDAVGYHDLLIPLESDHDVKKFLQAILKEFVEKVDIIDSGLTDDLIACHVINDADKESLDGSHVPTRRERARKLWTILTTIHHTVFVRKVLPPLCRKLSHIIPSRFWRQSDVIGPQRPNDFRGGCDDGCTRCAVEKRIRAGDMADFLLRCEFIQLDTHKYMCSGYRNGTDWARVFKLFKSASHDKITRHSPELKDILERHSLKVPRDLCDVMRKGFPCTCKRKTATSFLPRQGLACLSPASSYSSVCSSSPSLRDLSSSWDSDLSLQDAGTTTGSNRSVHDYHNNSNAAASSAVSAVSYPNLLLQNTWNSSTLPVLLGESGIPGEYGMSRQRGCSLPDCLGESGRQGETGLLTDFRHSIPPVPAESWSPEESQSQEESGIASEPRPSLASSCRVADTRLEAGTSTAHPPGGSAGHCDDDIHQTAVKQLETAVWIEEEGVTFRKAYNVFSEEPRLKGLNEEETRLEMFDDEETRLKVLNDEETRLNILDDEEETRLKVLDDEEETQLNPLDEDDHADKQLSKGAHRVNVKNNEDEPLLKSLNPQQALSGLNRQSEDVEAGEKTPMRKKDDRSQVASEKIASFANKAAKITCHERQLSPYVSWQSAPTTTSTTTSTSEDTESVPFMFYSQSPPHRATVSLDNPCHHDHNYPSISSASGNSKSRFTVEYRQEGSPMVDAEVKGSDKNEVPPDLSCALEDEAAHTFRLCPRTCSARNVSGAFFDLFFLFKQRLWILWGITARLLLVAIIPNVIVLFFTFIRLLILCISFSDTRNAFWSILLLLVIVITILILFAIFILLGDFCHTVAKNIYQKGFYKYLMHSTQQLSFGNYRRSVEKWSQTEQTTPPCYPSVPSND